MKRLSRVLISIGIAATMLLGSCTDSSLFGEWKCYDFTIADTTGIPAELIKSGVESAKSTTLFLNEDSTYQEDYVVEDAEIISTLGNYSIIGDSICFSPVQMGGKELTDTSAIEYRYIANDERLASITFPKRYKYELKDNKLMLKEMIYSGASRSKTNETTMFYEKTRK
ncbi:MAG: hypothetical protein J6T28_04425 [Paludibacteraceae bacterium]|nr:hypothetical protein [Paludibacteraceae bacterium]MBP5481028.1 hypothetical protein [Paludibacteraceae bacterium]